MCILTLRKRKVAIENSAHIWYAKTRDQQSYIRGHQQDQVREKKNHMTIITKNIINKGSSEKSKTK